MERTLALHAQGLKQEAIKMETSVASRPALFGTNRMTSFLAAALVGSLGLGYCTAAHLKFVEPRVPHAKAGSTAPHTYDSLLADLNARIVSFAKLAKRDSRDWMMHDRLATLQREKATVTGQSADYLQVKQTLDEAFAHAPLGSGPVLTAAKYHYAIHELNESERYLTVLSKQALVTGDKRTAGAILSANIAFQRGQYEPARKVFEECERKIPAACRNDLAIYEAHVGNFNGAEQRYLNSLSEVKPTDARAKAWLFLQLGIRSMERGRYDAALQHLRNADETLPGWWLIREHLAETLTLLNRWKEATQIYEEVVAQTGLPQYMDVLAQCYTQIGRNAEAAQLQLRAEQRWEEELQLLPSSASGHAIEHYLQSPGHTARLLELAKRNVEIRGNGKERSLLAEAYLKAGDLPSASLEIDRALNTPHTSVSLYDIARRIYAAKGDHVSADQFAGKARAIDPSYT